MASPGPRTALISRSWPVALTRIWRSVEGSLSSSVLQFRTYSNEGLDRRVRPAPGASIAHLSGKFPPTASATQSFSPRRSDYDRHAYPVSTFEGYRFTIPGPDLEDGRTFVAFDEAERPVKYHDRASRKVPQETNNHPLRQGFVCDTKLLPSVSACGAGDIHLASATTTNRAVAVLKNRQQQGLSIDSHTIIDVLKRCLEQKDLAAIRQVHDCIIQSGLDKHPRVATTLLNVYIKCGRLQDARRVFNGLQKTDRNVITWNNMIGAYAKSGSGAEAYQLFLLMSREGVTPDAITCLSILNASASAGALEWVKDVHSYALKTGLDADVRVGNALVRMYAKSGSIADARLIFDKLKTTNIMTWNIMVGAYAESGSGAEAFRLFDRMKREGFTPNAITCLSILNASASAGGLEWVTEVHCHVLKEGLESNVRVATALVRMYAKSGNIDAARLVFDKMENRDVITWNVMIGAYAESGCGLEAYQRYLDMKREGFIPNAFTYASILNAAASEGALEWVKEVHSDVLKAGLESDIRVANALVHMYAKSGSVNEARLVFDRMVKRDLITWNVMIGAYAESGCGMEAQKLFVQMEREGFIPDPFTYASILNAPGNAVALDEVKDIHSHAVKAGLGSHVIVGNALVRMYAKIGSLDEARQVFETMDKRDVTMWNIMIGGYAKSGRGIEAYSLFLQMVREGFIPDAYTYGSVLNAAASPGALDWVKDVHSYALKAGLVSDLRVGIALVRMYAKSGSVEDARLVFDKMEKRDVVAWNVIVGAYAESGSGEEAYRLFLQMVREGFTPDAFTYASILNAPASEGALEWVKDVHSHAMKARLDSDLRVGNALVHMYAKIGSLDDARLVFDRMEQRDVISWNVMIGAYAESGWGVEAYRLFVQMEREGFTPDAFTYANIVNAAPSLGALEWVKEVHSQALKAGLGSHVLVGNALVRMYARSDSIDEARQVFDKMEKRDVITWNVMIGAYSKLGCGLKAYGLLVQMGEEGFRPDVITYASILNAPASAGNLEWVKGVHSHALKAGLESDVRVGNALVHIYARSGSINDAKLVFDRLEKRDVVTWSIMIGGFAQHGRGQEALELFERMKADCFKPDGVTLLAVLSACSHGGLVEDGRRLFRAMEQDYGVEASLVHYNCMVDVLGRAGHLEEALQLIKSMPMEPDAVTWTALLGGCRTHRDVELGELAAEEVLKLEPKDAAGYVLLSNIYAAAGRWEKVVSVRNMMQMRGVRKEPGCSWIAVDNKIHEFVVGDTSHPESTAIYDVLQELTEKIKAKGYTPDKSLVLRNISDEDKELAVCSHSEKLAIAYGLLRIPPGKSIHIEKNLRICSDCHAATKLISEVTGREIIAKDANRFHHFKDGSCSCGDYW